MQKVARNHHVIHFYSAVVNCLNTERAYKWKLSGSASQSEIGIICFDQLAYSPRRFVLPRNLNFLRTGRKLSLISCVFCLRKTFKSVNPKILRIGRQKRKNDFFLIWPKEPFGYLFSEMASKGSISFSFLRNLQILKIWPQGLQLRL